MNLDFLNFFKRSHAENKLSHAFLIETQSVNDFVKIFIDFLYEEGFIKQKKLNNKNLIVVEPEKHVITVESIENLQRRFSKYPTDDKYNIYIIKNAEKFNKSSANKILKFLEEPDAPNIGILVTDSYNLVIDTIKSRTQLFKISSSLENLEEHYLHDDFLSIFNNDFNFKEIINLKNKLIILKREEIIDVFGKLITYYDKMLSNKTDNNIFNYVKLIENLEKTTNLLKGNVNIELALDRLFIELRK